MALEGRKWAKSGQVPDWSGPSWATNQGPEGILGDSLVEGGINTVANRPGGKFGSEEP